MSAPTLTVTGISRTVETDPETGTETVRRAILDGTITGPPEATEEVVRGVVHRYVDFKATYYGDKELRSTWSVTVRSVRIRMDGEPYAEKPSSRWNGERYETSVEAVRALCATFTIEPTQVLRDGAAL